MRSNSYRMCLGLGLVVASMIGCGEEAATETASTGETAAPAIDGSQFLLDAEPESAMSVIDARKDVADGDDIVVLGRIGGDLNPWIEGRAAFKLVDDSLRACSDIPGDMCTKPWDYCCETDKLPTGTALVKVVDTDGKLVKAGAKELLDVGELYTVVVKGKAKRDDANNLTILASGIFVKKTFEQKQQ